MVLGLIVATVSYSDAVAVRTLSEYVRAEEHGAVRVEGDIGLIPLCASGAVSETDRRNGVAFVADSEWRMVDGVLVLARSWARVSQLRAIQRAAQLLRWEEIQRQARLRWEGRRNTDAWIARLRDLVARVPENIDSSVVERLLEQMPLNQIADACVSQAETASFAALPVGVPQFLCPGPGIRSSITKIPLGSLETVGDLNRALAADPGLRGDASAGERWAWERLIGPYRGSNGLTSQVLSIMDDGRVASVDGLYFGARGQMITRTVSKYEDGSVTEPEDVKVQLERLARLDLLKDVPLSGSSLAWIHYYRGARPSSGERGSLPVLGLQLASASFAESLLADLTSNTELSRVGILAWMPDRVLDDASATTVNGVLDARRFWARLLREASIIVTGNTLCIKPRDPLKERNFMVEPTSFVSLCSSIRASSGILGCRPLARYLAEDGVAAGGSCRTRALLNFWKGQGQSAFDTEVEALPLLTVLDRATQSPAYKIDDTLKPFATRFALAMGFFTLGTESPAVDQFASSWFVTESIGDASVSIERSTQRLYRLDRSKPMSEAASMLPDVYSEADREAIERSRVRLKGLIDGSFFVAEVPTYKVRLFSKAGRTYTVEIVDAPKWPDVTVERHVGSTA